MCLPGFCFCSHERISLLSDFGYAEGFAGTKALCCIIGYISVASTGRFTVPTIPAIKNG